ncbi:glycosyltransferase 87 family protein [uncultured Amnibacterium sp.]|uniref:glycosyltransferase 87 family protein n=1 Tax=uncultured Amnibacterium sp. TaxID=1631851 RepID=UPI0035CA6C78
MRDVRFARVAPVAVLLGAIAAVTVALVAGVGVLTAKQVPVYFAFEGVCWTLFAAAVLLLLRVPRRAVPALVLAGTLLLGAAGATGQPIISTDSARYSWDGIVQDAGISPYRYVPADAALAPLRPEWLFPTPRVTDGGTVTCPGPRAEPTEQVGAPGTICTAINRPQVPTIYPPVAEALFALARLAVPPGAEYLPIQLLGLAAVLATTGLLLRTLRTTGRDPRYAAVFGWCPFVTMEAVTNAHVDAAAAFLALAATVLITRGRRVTGGVVLGLAIATKFLPVLVAPPLGRRRPWVIAAAALGTVAAVYLPHVIAVGPSVIGYLPGYLDEEGYDGGSRSALLSVLLPGSASTIAAAVLIAALSVVLLVRTDPAEPWAAQTLLVGTALVLVSPAYGWYGLLLVPFMVMSGRWEWFGVVIALSLLGVRQDPWAFRAILLAAALLPVLAAVRRARRGERILNPR